MQTSYFCSDQPLFFFDNAVKYPFLSRRERKPTEELPKQLREIRARLSNTFNKKKQPYDETRKGYFPYVKEAIAKVLDVKTPINTNLKKLKKLELANCRTGELSNCRNDKEEEDDGKFLFEETKFSATQIILELGKYLDVLVKCREEDSGHENRVTPSHTVKLKYYGSDVIWKIQEEKGLEKKQTQESCFILSEHLISILNFSYEDLIANAIHKKREWQTQTYKDILGYSKDPDLKPADSGIFSAPPTAMSGLYVKSDADEKQKKPAKQGGLSNMSLNKLHMKTSKYSGMTSESDEYRRESRGGHRDASRLKTRFENRYERVEKAGYRASQMSKLESMKIEESHETLLNPPIKDHMLSFAVSSRLCHEKGWIVQPSFMSDPEHYTLLALAQSRLQQAINERQKEELESGYQNKKCIVRYFGDTRLDITIKYKKGTAYAKKLKGQKDPQDKQPFMITMPEGGVIVYYTSGATAIINTKNGGQGNYTLVYTNETDGKLIAHFTPTGRGVCYHKNGQIAFISTNKFGSCHDENGALLKKWKWTSRKLIPPINFQLNPHITFRCSNKSSIMLAVNIAGEHAKIKVSGFDGAEDPKLSDMGSLLTMEKFSSQIAIQLSKSIPKKRSIKEKTSDLTLVEEEPSEDILENKIKDLEIKFQEEKDITPPTSYHLELKTLQKKMKEIITNWMDHYRIATGLKVPGKTAIKLRRHCKSAGPPELPSNTVIRKHKRVPSAPAVTSRHDNFSTVSRKSPSNVRPQSSLDDRTTQLQDHDFVSPRPLSALDLDSDLSSPRSKLPFKCGLMQHSPRMVASPPKRGCSVAMRLELLGDQHPQCRCTKRKVPPVTDVEFDRFLSELPKTQLVVISVVSESYTTLNPVDAILDDLHHEMNKNRGLPCVQSQYDAYRLFRYVIPNHQDGMPLLVRRHNVIPGMFMMYLGGKLLFASCTFNGYGTTKQHFLKQISRTRKEALQGHFLPDDFRFTPSQHKSSPRSSEKLTECERPKLNAIMENSGPEIEITYDATPSSHSHDENIGTSTSGGNVVKRIEISVTPVSMASSNRMLKL